ncbi:hypothetical protein D3C73_1521830 [compost metagenome]
MLAFGQIVPQNRTDRTESFVVLMLYGCAIHGEVDRSRIDSGTCIGNPDSDVGSRPLYLRVRCRRRDAERRPCHIFP